MLFICSASGQIYTAVTSGTMSEETVTILKLIILLMNFGPHRQLNLIPNICSLHL